MIERHLAPGEHTILAGGEGSPFVFRLTIA